MNNNAKIALSALIAVLVISLLFIIVPITSAFIVSYIFTLIAIVGIAFSLVIFGKGVAKVPQGHAFVNISVTYAVVCIIFSVIACVARLSLKWTLVPHIAIFAIFAIIAVALTSGSEYINDLDKKAEEKHREFEKEKENYWK